MTEDKLEELLTSQVYNRTMIFKNGQRGVLDIPLNGVKRIIAHHVNDVLDVMAAHCSTYMTDEEINERKEATLREVGFKRKTLSDDIDYAHGTKT